MLVEREISFNTDALKGPREFHKKWAVPLENATAQKITGRLIAEYSMWAGDVEMRVVIYDEGATVFKHDYPLLKGLKPTEPFKKAAATIDLDLPVNTKVKKGVAEIELAVKTALGSLEGVLKDLELATQ
jgi:hypothetical protein